MNIALQSTSVSDIGHQYLIITEIIHNYVTGKEVVDVEQAAYWTF